MIYSKFCNFQLWCVTGGFVKQKAKVQAVGLSPYCRTSVCDVVTDVTGLIDFFKLRHRHRDVCCHLLLCFNSEKVYIQCCLFAVSSFHHALDGS